MTDRAVRLLVIRHGESEWNASGRWQGLADVALSELGRRQAAEASMYLGVFDGIWSSELERAHHTAAIISELIGVGPVQIEPAMHETDVGPWQGLTTAQVEAEWPGFIEGDQRPEGFEPYDNAARRALTGLVNIAAHHPPDTEVLVVSHGGVIRSMRRLLGADVVRVPNLGGCWFEVHRDGTVWPGDSVDVLAAGTQAAQVL